jgi:hypothetical protein
MVAGVVVVCALASACGGDSPESAAVGDDVQTAAGDTPVPVAGARALNGLCVVGHEVRTFIPCGSKKVYWMVADQASLDAFQLAVERFTDEPFEPFFAEIVGRLSDETGEGFAADYDGQFFVEDLVRLAPASELDCDG